MLHHSLEQEREVVRDRRMKALPPDRLLWWRRIRRGALCKDQYAYSVIYLSDVYRPSHLGHPRLGRAHLGWSVVVVVGQWPLVGHLLWVLW